MVTSRGGIWTSLKEDTREKSPYNRKMIVSSNIFLSSLHRIKSLGLRESSRMRTDNQDYNENEKVVNDQARQWAVGDDRFCDGKTVLKFVVDKIREQLYQMRVGEDQLSCKFSSSENVYKWNKLIWIVL